ncbi:hypothetical protein EUX98_g5062 [Antrodiella citrinella]|uniref:Uncharacterized protein n=1 Tax=Antrodiella citrinella TaxID=2447956 RepID=A0A4S4MSJ2_9APHY|nr:hypothetical protein EUX98_g5062 [Antrodiella citrinella]
MSLHDHGAPRRLSIFTFFRIVSSTRRDWLESLIVVLPLKMDPESSDILGGRLPVVRDGSAKSSSFKSSLYLTLGAGLILWLVWLRVGPIWRQYRDTRYRKGMRRRHGIPDNDHRPFNVAYAAAAQARRAFEDEARRQRRASIDSQASLLAASQLQAAQANIRQRFGQKGTDQGVRAYQRRSHSAQAPAPRVDLHSYAEDDHTSDSHALYPIVEQSSRTRSGANRDRSGKRSRLSTTPVYGKHELEEEEEGVVDEAKESKKSRVESDGQVDGNEDAGWEMDEKEDSGMEIDEDAYEAAGRGSKRSPDRDVDEVAGPSRHSSKRLRKVSRGKVQEVVDHEMEDADDAYDLLSIPRGKKRDRGEVGSVFDGDESIVEEEEDKPRRHTRRRVVSHKKTSVSSRGQKRGADAFESDEEGNAKPVKRTMRQRRGQQTSEDSDGSEDDGMVSHDPLCKGRRIGEEWEVNGIFYKVGPNGQRLRQALVKRSRSRFPMPRDSEHPDRSASIDVFVETWLSDEQYQQAKDRHELAWQETPRQNTAEPDTPGDVPDITPAKSGKNLLWSSTVNESPTTRRPFRLSNVGTVGLRTNPFEQPMVASRRRISSVQSSPMPDSPKLRGSKSYSKWEKQDLEATAMAKLRERAQGLLAAASDKSVTPVAPLFTNGTTTAAAPVNSLFGTPPSTTTPATTSASAPSLSFGTKLAEPSKPSSISFPPAPTSAANGTENKLANVPGPPSFSFAPPSAKTPVAAPIAPTGTTNASNLFAQASAPTPNATTPTAAPSPNLFAPKPPTAASAAHGGMPPPAAPASASNIFAPKPQVSQPSATSNGVPAAQPAPPMFSFKAPAPPAQALNNGPSTPIFGSGQTTQPKPTQSAPSNGFNIFGAANNQPKAADSNVAPAGNSLFSRMSGFGSQPAAPQGSQPVPAASSSTFSFGATASSAPTPVADKKPEASSSTPSTSAPKFDFFGKGSSSNASAVPAPTTSNPAPAPAANSPFGASAFAGFGSNGTAKSTPPSNTFGNSSSGAGSAFGASTPAAGSAFGNPSPAGGNAFGNPTPADGNTFGTPSTTGSAFGTSTLAPAATALVTEAPKSAPLFSFGGPSTTPATSTAPGSAFGGSSTTRTSTFGSAPASSSSLFGAVNPPAPSSKPAASSQSPFGGGFGSTGFGGGAAPSPFGSTATNGSGSAFGGASAGGNLFGASAPSTAFGSTTSTASASKPAETESKAGPFKFNFGASSTSTNTTPAFGAPTPPAASAAPNGAATQPTLNSFGLGTPSNAFSFGASSSQK